MFVVIIGVLVGPTLAIKKNRRVQKKPLKVFENRTISRIEKQSSFLSKEKDMKVTVNGRLVAEGTHEECSPTLFHYLGMLSVDCVAMGPWGHGGGTLNNMTSP